MKAKSKSKYTSSESLMQAISPASSTTHIPIQSHSLKRQQGPRGETPKNDDSFDETRTYLTSMQAEQSGLKRTSTAIPGRRLPHETHQQNRVLTARPAINSICQPLPKQSKLQASKSEQDLGKHFILQSSISRDGLIEYDKKIQIIEQMELRSRGKVFDVSENGLLFLDTQAAKKPPSSQRIISREQTNAELSNTLLNVVNLQQCIFKYLEIKLKGQNKPLYLYFYYQDADTKFKMFLSRHTFTPNIFNCEEVFHKKVVLKYNEPGDTLQFVSDSVYLAIFPSQTTVINMKVQFGNGMPKMAQTRRVKPEREDGPHISLENLRKQIQMIKDNKREQILASSGGNLVEKNMEMEKHMPAAKEKQLAIRRVQSAVKINQALNRKRDMDQEKKDLILQRYEHSQKVKILREIFKSYQAIDDILSFGQREWLIELQMVSIVKCFRTAYCNKLRNLVDEHYKTRTKNKIRRKIRNFINRKGDTILKRTLIDQILQQIRIIVSTVRMFSKMIKLKSKKQARLLIWKYMRGQGMIGDLVNKIERTRMFGNKNPAYIIVCRLKQQYRNYKLRCKGYLERIVKLWNQKWGVFYQRIMKQDAERVREIRLHQSKGVLNLIIEEERQKAPFIDTKHQQAIVQTYFHSCKKQFHRQMSQLLKMMKRSYSSANQKALSAAQSFGGDKTELSKVKLFQPVNDELLQSLMVQYLSEKQMLKSELI